MSRMNYRRSNGETRRVRGGSEPSYAHTGRDEKIAGRKNCDLELGYTLASCAADGVQFEFRMAEIGDNSFFSARRKGAKILVTLNSLHAFGREFGGIDEWSHPAVLALLAAWARCEIDSGDTPQSERYEEARSDWGRVLRSLLGMDSPFSSRRLSYL